MTRKHKYIIYTAIISSLLWIYWSTSKEVDNTLIFINNYNQNKLLRSQIHLSPTNSTCLHSPYIIILVTSYVGHVELRSAHRRSFSQDYLNHMNIKRIFLLASIPQNEIYITQESIEDESRIFGDILQGTFKEHYRNLTYKHLMGLEWAAEHCSQAKYILKVDDDTVFNIVATKKLLESKQHDNKILLGYMLNNTKPRRQMQNKWYVTMDEYSRSGYPSYLSGWYYITTPNVAARLVEESTYHPYFWIDDILVTGILAESLKIKLSQLPKDYWLEYYELLECCIRDMINRGIKCQYAVGPNGGRDNLIYEFNTALMNCDKHKNCTTRPTNQPLKSVCIAFKDRTIFSEGQPEIENIKL